tara:strand:+ start:198 stop:842 length:645 start_codon:yes stop_codon:yes gene_type:complete
MLTLFNLTGKRANKLLFVLTLIFTLTHTETHSQDFLDEFDSLIEEESIDLLPEKMIFTQKWLWGEKGLLRKTGISELTLENREKELILREKLLKAHQILGYVTFAGMIAQGIVGSKLYNGDYSLEDTHEAIGAFVNTTYFTGAGLSLFTPPPLVSREIKGFNNMKAHKILATIHASAMIMTNLTSEGDKSVHRASAYSAFGSYTLAMIAVTFNF